MAPKDEAGRACAFCGEVGKKMSGEHLWPEWVRKRLPAGMATEKYEHRFATGNEGEYRRIKKELFTYKVKCVCEDCNTGWMHRLEDAAIPLLNGPLAGRRKPLHRNQQATLAAWATMKALVFQLAHGANNTIIPASHYREVYATRDTFVPPHGVQVFTAATLWREAGNEIPGFFHSTGIHFAGEYETHADPDWTDGYVATTSFFNVVMHVFWPYDTSLDIPWGFGQHVAPSIRRIWPFIVPFHWPPGPALTQRGLRAVAGAPDRPPQPVTPI